VDRRWLGSCCETTTPGGQSLSTGHGEASVHGESNGNSSFGRLVLLENIFR
jgi:hypothetical protein